MTATPDLVARQADDLRIVGERIAALIEASAATGPAARSRAEDLVAAVSGLYGAGLARIIDVLRQLGRLDSEVLGALVSDELISGLLLVHDLHPDGVETRIRAALDTVRPYLGSHGGDVEFLGIDQAGVVRLRLLGSCDGCPSSAATLQLAVEGAVEAAAPEMTRIEVLAPSAAPAAGVISLDSLRQRIDGHASSAAGHWVAVPELAVLAPGELAGFEVDGLAVCACALGREVFCFRDRCGRCGRSLAGSALERRLGDPVGTGVLRCSQCHAHFDIRRAGAGLDADAEHLDPLPVLVRDGLTSVALPVVA